MIHETISIPRYVLKHAPKYLSDFEFRLMLNMLNVKLKKDWDNVAGFMGYDNVGPITTAMNKLVESGKANINKYEVSFEALFNLCLLKEYPEILNIEATAINQVEKKSPKPKKTHEFYVLWGDMCNVALLAGDKNNWAKKVLPQLEFDREDILGYATYIESYYVDKDKGLPERKNMIFPNIRQLQINIQRWIDGGRKEKFEPKKTTFDLSGDNEN